MISGSTRGCSMSAPDRLVMIASRWCPCRMQCRDGGGRPQRESSKERCNMTDALREKLVQAGRVRVSEQVGGSMPRHSEVFIHSEILRARSDIAAVVHTHPPHAVAFSSLGRPLLPVGNDGAIFCAGVPVFSETTDLIIDQARDRAVARCLGDHQALILRNHGIVTAGR